MKQLINLKTAKQECTNHKDSFNKEKTWFTCISQEKRQGGWFLGIFVPSSSNFNLHELENASDVKIEAEEKEKEEEDVAGKIHENFLPFQGDEASHDRVAH